MKIGTYSKFINTCIALFVFSLSGDFILAETTGIASVEELLVQAYQKNASLQAAKHRLDSEEALVWSKMIPENPVLSFQELNRGDTTTYRGIGQRFRFPVKYFLSAKAQSSLAKSEKSQLEWERWHLRYKVVTLYYAIYSLQKMIELTKANKDIIREFSRVAEKKYVAGKTSQSDSMKAHFELTQMELKLIQLEEEEHSLQSQLQSVMNNLALPPLIFLKRNLSTPIFYEHKVQKPLKELSRLLQKNSPKLKKEMHLLRREKWKTSLEKWEFAPDVELKYQERIAGKPGDSKIQSIHFHFPLWFFSQRSLASSQASKRRMQEHLLDSTQKNLMAQVIRLRKKVHLDVKRLQIYQTSLIPQSRGAYHSSKVAYKASKNTFLELIDSERALLNSKIGFYKVLWDYVKSLCALELALGFEVSNIVGIKGGQVK